jgi:hypothetical protein
MFNMCIVIGLSPDRSRFDSLANHFEICGRQRGVLLWLFPVSIIPLMLL